MTHDPLCPILERRATCQCQLIAKVDKRAIATRISHYNDGYDMCIAEAREAIRAVPWRTDAAGAVILRVDAVKAIDALRGKE